jgi:hypothetical protein
MDRLDWIAVYQIQNLGAAVQPLMLLLLKSIVSNTRFFNAEGSFLNHWGGGEELLGLSYSFKRVW